MKSDDEMFAQLALRFVVIVLQIGCVVAGLAFAPWYGFPALILGVCGALFFGMAKPPPGAG